MKRLKAAVLATVLASAVLAIQASLAIAAPLAQAPVPNRSCLTAEAKNHLTLSLAQAKACAPEAAVLTGHNVTKPGRYLMSKNDGYLIVGFGNRIEQHGIILDAQADQCSSYSGGSFREIYSWEYGGNFYGTEDSGNCVFTGSSVYNIWNSTSCSFTPGTCSQNRFVLCNWCFQINPGVDFPVVYYGGTGSDQYGIRQYLDANWNESWWVY